MNEQLWKQRSATQISNEVVKDTVTVRGLSASTRHIPILGACFRSPLSVDDGCVGHSVS